MNTESELGEFDIALDPAEAFEAMRRQLALLAAAVEGFASRQQAIEARDYTPDIARLIDRQDKVREALLTLAARPGIALTPETLAKEITEAGNSARRSDHEILQRAAERQRGNAQILETIIGQARDRQQQTDALIWAALAGMIAASMIFVAGSLLRERLAAAPAAQITANAVSAAAGTSDITPMRH